MTKVLSSDILIIDANIKLSDNLEMARLAEKYELMPGAKTALNAEQFTEFSRALVGYPVTFTPGGSAANTLTTLSKLMGDELECQFIGVVGKSAYSQMIRDGLHEAHVKLIPEDIHGEPRPESAVSFVLIYPDGQRTIATYPGNAKEILKPSLITDDLVSGHDAIFIQGSLWQKLGPEFPDSLMEKRWAYGKELWLAMPTHAKFGEEKADLFQWLIPSADVVLSNEEELARIYKTTPDHALQKLQDAFKANRTSDRLLKISHHQVGFITRGEKGAVVVMRSGLHPIDSVAIDPKDIKNMVGAGDTAFAGFLFGMQKGMSHELSAQIAMRLAGEKLKINQARLPSPKETLKSVMPELYS
ncbi:MAG: carbohydrate kinase family protein [Rickettsiales bacterium]|jgi:sugar/nucleoside kinase (ribokinase family)|nr:carbohydrate kinase family protein [Rickettsiales bacterium]